jgi:IclR family pca regulon transcriptional regulator
VSTVIRNAVVAGPQRDTLRDRPPFAVSRGRDPKEFLGALAKGLAVLSAFGPARPSMSLTDAAAVAGLSRAAARRVLLTLCELGYVDQKGRDFTLSPRILDLGFSYLAILSWVERVEPLLKELSAEFQEVATAATLHGVEAVVVAHSPAPAWIMSSSMSVGTRFPAFHSALGRIQLGYLDEPEIWRRVHQARIEPYTPSTIVDFGALVERVKADREQGFSLVDEELEKGLRALAVPLVSHSGRLVGAINLSSHTARTTRNELRDRHLPRLKAVAAAISSFIV